MQAKHAWATSSTGNLLRAAASLAILITALPSSPAAAEGRRVWEKVEITLRAANSYSNPYKDVQVWVNLKGPGLDRRCYGFWDGGDSFRVRVLAIAPGTWTWLSGSRPADPGLSGRSGTFTASAWTEKEKQENPCRRGMIRPSPNGHAFQYADGTPWFLLGDTWWAASTSRFPWHDDDRPRPMGPQAGLKDYVQYRRGQEFNCVAILAALPNWANDGQPAGLKTADGTVLRSAWRQAGTQSAKDMTDEEGRRPFLFPGKVPGYETVFPDLERINPAYFHALDKKIDYLNAQGMIPFIEVARRDIGQAWKKYYPWPESYTRYIQYVWSRYQANICLLSPIHFDTPAQSIPAEDWNLAANGVIEKYGPPPFGTLAGTNSNPSSLRNWGHVDKARWLGFHQIGNRRTHDVYPLLTEIFRTSPPVPAINGEPYYDGMENLEGGTKAAARYCRSAMYGSVLSGGLGGHIYGAGGWDGGLWSGEVEPESKYPIWKVIAWPSANQMRHLKAFVLSEGSKYQDLVPEADLLSSQSAAGKGDRHLLCEAPSGPFRQKVPVTFSGLQAGDPKTCLGWAYCARTGQRDLFLLYFEKDCPQASLSGLLAERQYKARWFNPRTGQWMDAGPGLLQADAAGKAILPRLPGDETKSSDDWAMKLSLTPDRDLRNVIGVTHVAGKYHLTGKDFLAEGADQVLAVGSRVIKLYLTLPPERNYPFNSKWPKVQSLVELAGTPYYRAVFEKPFTTCILTTYSAGRPQHYWRKGVTDEEARDEEEQFYRLARHLLTTYRASGKTFVLQHWEGDWAIRGSFDPKTDPPPEAIAGMVRWLGARQKGVERTRAEVKDTKSRVFHAAEVNLVKIGMKDGRPTVADRVLPKARLDLVSYSAWDTQANPALLREALDYIGRHAYAKGPFGARNVYLGEFGLPENDFPLARVQQTVRGAIRTALDWGCPYVVYWQLYCNEARRQPAAANGDVRGFWLLRPDGSKAWAWQELHDMLNR